MESLNTFFQTSLNLNSYMQCGHMRCPIQSKLTHSLRIYAVCVAAQQPIVRLNYGAWPSDEDVTITEVLTRSVQTTYIAYSTAGLLIAMSRLSLVTGVALALCGEAAGTFTRTFNPGTLLGMLTAVMYWLLCIRTLSLTLVPENLCGRSDHCFRLQRLVP